MKKFKSLIRLTAVATAIVTMSGCLTSCDAMLDMASYEPYHESYRVVEVHHRPSYYGHRDTHYYGHSYSAPSSTANVSFGRR